MTCPFDNVDPNKVFHEDDLFLCLWDGYAVSQGHALVITRRHIASWFDATDAEQQAILRGISIAKDEIVSRYSPDGFNIGINVNAAAGQTVPHLHVHVIPRYAGDVHDPRGGIRHVIPDRGNYLVRDAYRAERDFGQNLSTGRENPLLPKLRADIDRASAVDCAVAFTLDSGLSLVHHQFQELLDRGGRLRFLTGDYLSVTEPAALLKLLDLSGGREIKVFESRQQLSFHPKAYVFRFPDGTGRAYVGSSNLTRSALSEGVEWNYGIVSSNSHDDFVAICNEFERLFSDQRSRAIDQEWVRSYESRRAETVIVAPLPIRPEPPPTAPLPHEVQAEALVALEGTRAAGNRAGLVVLATGLGKTWLSAFDSVAANARRVLFVAHREEILRQASATFRRIRPDAILGNYGGVERDRDADVLFASIQTLGRLPHLRGFAKDAFDYIVVDEFHHASARTYRNLIEHFEPKFLLGLTATPERTDGGDLLALCGESLVYRCDLFEGIDRGLLSPFRYFGVPDTVDYSNIPWRSTRFDPEELEAAVATQARAENAYEHWQERGGERTLAFCCSMRHADYMAEFFSSNGVNARAVHSGAGSAPRASSLQELESGQIEVLFAVDMFNEGVDVPNIDTVLMLRPTESAILWTQQVGRGLRRVSGKKLTVIDYIGNHRIFLTKLRSLLSIGASDNELRLALSRIQEGSFELPAGCEITYELEAVTILEALLKPPARGSEVVEAYYHDFRERIGKRPSAREASHDGYNPRQTGRARWLDFVRDMGDMNGQLKEAYGQHKDFLGTLEVTPMTKCFKMVVLLAMLNEDAFPGSIEIGRLIAAVRLIASRTQDLAEEFGSALHDDEALRLLLEKNPITAWAGGRGGEGKTYFRYDKGLFSTIFDDAPAREELQELTREIAEWRLADYQQRASLVAREGEFICRVFHADGKPILKLPDRQAHPNLPMDWVSVMTEEGAREAKFSKIAVNVLREPGGDRNILPQLMRKWFGPDAGRPGTNFRVTFSVEGDGYRMAPQNPTVVEQGGQLWRAYAREQIPGLFGFEFSTGSWNQGMVVKPGHIFLFVTLEKGDMAADHRYLDHFESPAIFSWQSQNRTTQASTHGQMLSEHRSRDISVHLFVRKNKKNGSKAAPFIYCGEIDFLSWEGDMPISVRWNIRVPLPERIYESLI